MNVMEIVQSILTYFCTAGFVSAVAYFFHKGRLNDLSPDIRK